MTELSVNELLEILTVPLAAVTGTTWAMMFLAPSFSKVMV